MGFKMCPEGKRIPSGGLTGSCHLYQVQLSAILDSRAGDRLARTYANPERRRFAAPLVYCSPQQGGSMHLEKTL